MSSKLHDLRLGISIAEHDLAIKIKQADKWLKSKDQVRITVLLKGREKSRPETAVTFLLKIADRLSDVGTVQKAPSSANLSIVINPKK